MVAQRVSGIVVALVMAFVLVLMVTSAQDAAPTLQPGSTGTSENSSGLVSVSEMQSASNLPAAVVDPASPQAAATPSPVLPPGGLTRSSEVPLPNEAVPVRLEDWGPGDNWSVVVNVPMDQFIESQYQLYLASGWAVLPISREISGGWAGMRIASGTAWADVRFTLQAPSDLAMEDIEEFAKGNNPPLNIIVTVDGRPGLPPGPKAITDLAPLEPLAALPGGAL